MGQLRQAFPGTWKAAWDEALHRIEQAGYGEAVASAYRQFGPQLALHIAPASAIRLGRGISETAIRAGRGAAAALPQAALQAATRLGEEDALVRWFAMIELVGRHAPESVPVLLQEADSLLGALDIGGLEAFIRMGLAAGRGSPERRLRFFKRQDDEARRFFDREAGDVGFAALERQVGSYFTALWGIRPMTREVPRNAPEHLRRRAGFGGGLIRLPSAFPGFSADDSRTLYHAALAHIGAHFRYGGKLFAAEGLKPLQIALVSLVEDARVEYLAQRDMPGLATLWRPFHVARPDGAAVAVGLMARLARALADPNYDDGDGWVCKGRALVEQAFATTPSDPALSRRIGGILGNDLGQMRLQFDSKTYVVQPAYRDDNLGLWDFGEEDHHDVAPMEETVESARMETEERDEAERQDPKEEMDDQVSRMSLRREEQDGVLAARYPEFDYGSGRERPEWCAVREYRPKSAHDGQIRRLVDERADLIGRLTALIRGARISRQERVRRQSDGEFLDIDACIDAVIARRIGEAPDPRVHGRYQRRNRDLAVQLLLDVSRSAGDKVSGTSCSVLDFERQAVALMAQAMADLGDTFAVAAFCSDTREDVRYLRVKNFAQSYDTEATQRLAGLESGLSTRLGAAMRHAAVDLHGQRAYRRLLLVITDGEPSDIDVDDESYLVEDARAAVHSLRRHGIDAFCIVLHSDAESYADRIFGRRNVVAMSAIERLPEKLPALYFRLAT